MNKPIVQFNKLLDSDSNIEISDKCNMLFGVDTEGLVITEDLDSLGTIFIAGTTGSGKSLFLETSVLSIMENYPTNKVKLLLVDTKGFQFPAYNNLPNLLCPVVNNPSDALNIITFLGNNKEETNSPIVIFIDDIYDLLIINAELTYNIIDQLHKQNNVHVILSTASPHIYKKFLIIKPHTIVSFHVSKPSDSESILGHKGAEELKGKGDMLFKRPNNKGILRIQAPFISNEDIYAKLDSVRTLSKPRYAPALLKLINSKSEKIEIDPLLEDVKTVLKSDKPCTVGDIQKRLQVGYARAVKLLEQARTDIQETK